MLGTSKIFKNIEPKRILKKCTRDMWATHNLIFNINGPDLGSPVVAS